MEHERQGTGWVWGCTSDTTWNVRAGDDVMMSELPEPAEPRPTDEAEDQEKGGLLSDSRTGVKARGY